MDAKIGQTFFGPANLAPSNDTFECDLRVAGTDSARQGSPSLDTVQLRPNVDAEADTPSQDAWPSTSARKVVYAALARTRCVPRDRCAFHRDGFGLLSTGFVRELSHPLATAANYVNAARRVFERADAAAPHLVSEHLRQASQQLARAGLILRRAWGGAPSEGVGTHLQDLGSAVRDAIAQAALIALDPGQHLGLDISPDARLLLVDPAHLTQTIVSLVQTAAAILCGGSPPEIWVTVEAHPQRDKIDITILASGTAKPAQDALPLLHAAPFGVVAGTPAEPRAGEMQQTEVAPAGRSDQGVTFRFTLPAFPAGMRDT